MYEACDTHYKCLIDSADGSTEENVQLTQLPTTPSETSALQALTSKAAQD